jgi:hypothetical protein
MNITSKISHQEASPPSASDNSNADQGKGSFLCAHCYVRPFCPKFYEYWLRAIHHRYEISRVKLEGIGERDCLWCLFLQQAIKRHLQRNKESCSAALPKFYVIKLSVTATRGPRQPEHQYRAYQIDVYSGKLSEVDKNAEPLFCAIGEVTLEVSNYTGM